MSGPKGIDDLFFGRGNARTRRLYRVPAEVTSRRLPYELRERAPVRTGRSMPVVRSGIITRIERFVRDSVRTAGRALPVYADPGTGKTTAAASAVKELGIRAVFAFGTKKMANEFAAEHGFLRIRERNSGNCLKPELVRTLGERGFPVGKLACGSEDNPICPFRLNCMYFRQFDEPGPKVGTTEQLFNPYFLRGAELVVVDDADLDRALLRRRTVSLADLQNAIGQLKGRKREPARNLAQVLAHAVIEAAPTYTAGPGAWDHIARVAAQQGNCLADLVEALPKQGTLLDPHAANGHLTVESVLAVPPANLRAIYAALQEELPAFLTGEDFNSRLRVNASGIEVTHMKDHPRDREGFFISRSSMLILDATPIPVLMKLLTRHHALLPAVAGAVSIPPNVTVVQYAGTSNGHTSLSTPAAIEAVKRQIRAERVRYPVAPEHEALIVFKGSVPAFADLGFVPENVLHFGAARGTNALAKVRRLHVVGRPFPPPGDLWYLAQVLCHDGDYVLRDMVVRPAPYAGQPWAVDVADYVDPRMAELLNGFREAELWQVVHRARLVTMEAQVGLGDVSDRPTLRLVIHTSQPIPGLPVDEFFPGAATRTVNDDRRDRAELQVRRAIQELTAAGEPLGERAIARQARVTRRTARKQTARLGKVVHTPADISSDNPGDSSGEHGTVVPTLIEEGSNGGYRVPMSSSPMAALCRGGCRTPMPEGQSCPNCAERAVHEWKRRSGRGGR